MDAQTIGEAIRTSVQRCAELTQELKHERAVRDRLIVQALSRGGFATVEVARSARVTPTHVTRILASAID